MLFTNKRALARGKVAAMSNSESAVQSGFMRRETAAKYLGVSTRCLSDWQKRRIIPYCKVARKVILFARPDLDKAIAKFKVAAVGG